MEFDFLVPIDNEIIDYQFPPKVKVRKVTYLLRLLYSVVVNLLSFGAKLASNKKNRFPITMDNLLFFLWCARRDSNARPLAPEANALSG